MAKTEREINKLIRVYLDRLLVAGIKVEKIILFGSYARNVASADSDFDVAIISPSFEKLDIIERQILLSKAGSWGLDVAIEALGYSLKEFRSPQQGSFLDEILRTGKILYDAQHSKAVSK
jgi:predicted nucleotidyltransferase